MRPFGIFLGLMAIIATSPAADPIAKRIDFNRDVRPILSNNCVACHGPDEKERKAELRLDLRADAVVGEAFVIGKPDESAMIQRILSKIPSVVMPPPKTGKHVTPRELDILKRWIAEGAEYNSHWAYLSPKRTAAPIVKTPSRVRNFVDAFLLAKLEREGLTFQPEADKATLIRRLSLDLTGLPPTLAEVDDFLADASPTAYETLVDKLLAKSSFGEHWARPWLDLARYADSAGYADDPSRTIWPYRDWVIRAFNANLPYDRFTIEQIAGDLLPNATLEQRTATAFHRNTMTNNEGGTSDEEFRNAAVVDRTNTTMAVWMGTSMACAQCHTHKYDPITQTEYFRFLAFFNSSEDADRRDESPLLKLDDTPEKKAKRDLLAKEAATLAKLAKFPDPRVQAVANIRAESAKAEAAKLLPKVTVPVMRELPEMQRRVTKLQMRGNYLDLGDTVTEGTPAAFHPLPKDAPKNRLTLAKWLVDPANPLAARVAVNRAWEAIFGVGLVRTSEEFGAQGDLPLHPELLDALAFEFTTPSVTGGKPWDQKALLRLLVTSAAYRQSSKVTPELASRDPDNLLLARGPRFRLTAEMVRDQALAVSGLLSSKMYGPSVKPPQPSFGLSAAFGGGLDWQTSAGEDKYRRGLYTEWRRTNPYPSMMTFDATSREACTIRRSRSNTPLQALVTLNDPVYVEAAVALAKQTTAKPEAERLNFLVRTALGRLPSGAERDRLKKLFDGAKAKYQADTKVATLLVGKSDADLAAWAVTANVILNLDEFLMKR